MASWIQLNFMSFASKRPQRALCLSYPVSLEARVERERVVYGPNKRYPVISSIFALNLTSFLVPVEKKYPHSKMQPACFIIGMLPSA
ncbi:hypothetical protein AMECASPLE_003405 [Ameca splendens]|uniref:Uncharacterized protein n=1 Tax=Ameca splendens TaxID=208324 RepID=A0ABV0YKL5_9TELE